MTIDLDIAVPSFPMPRAAHDAPPVAYATFRRERPVTRVRLWNGSEAWLVTRYDDVRMLLSDDRFSAVASAPGYPHVTPGREVTNRQEPSFIQMDGAEHDRQRRMVNPDFVVKRVAEMQPRIIAIVDDLLDRLSETERPVDLVSAFALPIPALVICEILGVPPEDREYFHDLAAVPLSNASLDDAASAMTALKDYLDRLIRVKEQAPGSDLLSRLAVEHLQTGALSRAELVSMALLLLVAGHETTANMISLGTHLFLDHPDQGAVLRTTDDPRVVERAVEELLRYMTIVQYSPARVATADVEIGGEVIHAGEGVFALIESANRDADAFEAPDMFDTTRARRHHVAFGYGRHQCLGQWLARLELQVALPALFRRFPNLALAPAHEVRFKYDMTVFGIHELRVVW